MPNLFGLEIGGFWLTPTQLEQLRKLPDCYPASEVGMAKRALDAYLLAQTEEFNGEPRAGAEPRAVASGPSATLPTNEQ